MNYFNKTIILEKIIKVGREKMKKFYTYAYVRKDRSPYYIGKGTGRRMYGNHKHIPVPPKDRILLLKENLSNEEAIRHEMYLISVLGRKSEGGILINQTPGGEGFCAPHTEESKKKMREAKRPPVTEETKKKISVSLKEKWKNNPRPVEYYEKNLQKMAERNRTDKKKQQKHSEFMKDKKYAAKPVKYKGIEYPSMANAMEQTGLSRYFILKG
jgi:hypothetical protein